VVIVLAAVYGLTLVNHTATLGPGQQVLPPRSAAATSVVRACPSLGLAGPAAAAALVAAPPTAGQGLAELSRLNGTANAPSLRRVTNPGRLSTAKVRAAGAEHPAAPSASGGPHVPTVASRGGAVVQASGSMARGLEVEQITAGGIPLARCGSPGTDFWFVGPGEHSLARIQLFLVNAGSQPAAANVEISTDAGPLQGSPDTGIAVPPHSMVVQYLASLVRGSRVLALHVRTSTGQVVAAVRETTHAGSSGAWLPAAQPPATRVVLPGLPAAAGTRQLFVTVPGAQDAHLKLTAAPGSTSPVVLPSRSPCHRCRAFRPRSGCRPMSRSPPRRCWRVERQAPPGSSPPPPCRFRNRAWSRTTRREVAPPPDSCFRLRVVR
jgi:hypothetical protein